MEEYAAKMQAKSEAELRQYVSSYGQYRDDAVLAALAELRRRGLPAPEEAALRPALEAAVARQQAEAAAVAAARPATADPATADDPELYSPGTIVLFSVLFSMLAGGILLGINLRRLHRNSALLALIAFVLAYAAAGVYAMNWAAVRFGQNLLLPVLFNVLALVAYLTWFWPRYVGPRPYRSRGWLLPFLLFFALQLGLVRIVLPLMKKNGFPGGPPAAVPTMPAAPAKTR